MDKILFVYGTLMQGMRNHSYLEKAEFIGPAQTKPEYELMYNGSIPAVKAGTESVKGELYKVNDDILKSLDVLEEVDANLYDKQEIEVNGQKVIAYLGGSIFNQDTWEHVPNADYRALAEKK